MSTFGGVMEEFPDIRVDYFRQVRSKPGQKAVPPALACFLSHVHTDHTEGLEAPSFRAPFIYCSAATKEILLRLEKYPHRLNFARGILEAQRVHFKHLKNILKPVPLETPTRIELSPGNEIQVTLFDANHCAGAVMFLFEGHGKAVLYTGDIRSEPWMVNNLSRNPLLIEYTSGLKALDCIYLDTSNTRQEIPFPTKAAGLQELLSKVCKYPTDTVFHFEAWTFGYEEVWIALSKSLKSPIHVDRYKLKLYQSLRGEPNGQTNSTNNFSGIYLAHEAPSLVGYTCGNTPQTGCLTSDTDVRIHSCEKGMHCSVLNEKTVWIRPIITRSEGEEMPELGVGGGGGDLNQHPDLVLNDDVAMEQVMGLFEDVDEDVKLDIKKMLSTGLGANGRTISLDGMDLDREEDGLSLTQMAKMVARSMERKRRSINSQRVETITHDGEELPRVITFPYSRHSSYEELVHLVSIFKPKEVYPCTVHENRWVQEGISIGDMFGHECSTKDFRHDREMAEMFPDRSQLGSQKTQVTSSQSSQALTNSPRRPVGSDEPTVFFHKDAQNRLRGFQVHGNELSHEASASSPQRITATTPGAESQNLRRKAILDELERGSKRIRLQDQDGAPTAQTEGNPQTNEPGSNIAREIIMIPDSSDTDKVDTPGSEVDSDSDSDSDGDRLMFFDNDEGIWRCTMCASELWTENGFCTGCDEGETDIPYYENGYRQRPNIFLDEYTDQEVEDEERLAIVGNYLDDDSSAYDSQDSQSKFDPGEYEQNSFIDDSPSDEEQEVDAVNDSDSDDDSDQWKAKYQALATGFTALASEHRLLEFEYRELRMDIGLDDEDDDDDERDEEGMLIIGIPEPKVVTTEVILSSSEEQSDSSEISEDRILARAEAFEAVNGVSGRNWHEISLVSTTNNHTHEEIEL